MEQAGRDGVAGVIDLQTPVNDYVAAQRAKDPTFAMSKDGVHVDEVGHRILAEVMLDAWGLVDLSDEFKVDPANYALVAKRQKILHDAWLSHVGHKRPGTKAGLPLDEAQAQAAAIDQQLKKTQ